MSSGEHFTRTFRPRRSLAITSIMRMAGGGGRSGEAYLRASHGDVGVRVGQELRGPSLHVHPCIIG